MALSDNIKKAREKQGVSQEFLADKLGVSRQAVSKWETGQTEPSTQNLLRLAEILKVDANLLLNESKERKIFAKENIEQNGVRISLNKRNAIFLIASCTSQMFAWSVNPGQIDLSKYVLIGVSFFFMVLLLCSIWVRTGRATRAKLMLRVFVFSVVFNAVVVGCYSVAGGFAALIAGIIFMVFGLKIVK